MTMICDSGASMRFVTRSLGQLEALGHLQALTRPKPLRASAPVVGPTEPATETEHAAVEQSPDTPAPAYSSKTLLGSPRAFIPHFEGAANAEGIDRVARYDGARVRRHERLAALRALNTEASSGEAGGMVDVDPQRIAETVREKLRARAARRKIDIVIQTDCDHVRVHPFSFTHALFELCENALTATRRPVPIVLDVQRTAKGDALWQIRDAGKGMSHEVLGGLGKPPDTRLRVGPGLGIPFAWTVVEKHNGLVRFESAKSVGTTATIWLPGRDVK